MPETETDGPATVLAEIPETLPCGCRVTKRIVAGERQFVIEPCSMDCKYLAFALEESGRQGNEIRTRRGSLGTDGRGGV